MRLKEFLNRLRELDGWYLTEIGEIRRHNKCCECPITAVLNARSEIFHPIGLSLWQEAAKSLNVSLVVAYASDNLKHSVSCHHWSNIKKLRRFILQATGLIPDDPSRQNSSRK